jgi:hypothetical protein
MSKKCPFRLANPFNPADGSWYWVTDTTYGGSFTEATGNGTTDDRAAIQSCLNAAASAGKNVYFPAGTYKVIPSGGAGLILPSGVTLRGVGDTSIISIYDDGTDDGNRGLSIDGKSNIALRYLKLTGTVTAGASYPSQYPSVQMILVDEGVSGLTLDHVPFDRCEYALRFIDDSGNSSSAVAGTNCATLSSVINPFFLARVSGVTVSDCTLAAATVGQQAGRWPHHFYVATAVDDLLVEDCTCTGGQHATITTGPVAAGESLIFRRLTFTGIAQGFFDYDVAGSVLYEDFTIDGTNAGADEAWFVAIMESGGQATYKNFQITGKAGNWNYLVHRYGSAGSVLVKDGSVTNCYTYGMTPAGAAGDAGVSLTYDNVTVNGTPINWP